MKVTEVRITKAENAENPIFLGFASVSLDDAIVIHNIAILNGSNGLYISFPDRRSRNGNWVDIVHPANKETREYIQEEILKKYAEDEA